MEIMDAIPSRSLRGFVSFAAILLAATCPAAELVLQKVPPLTVAQAPQYPQNLARVDLGAQLEATPKAEIAAQQALLSNDPGIGYLLNSGTTMLLVSLPKIENVETISFLNNGVKGTVAIATANAKLPADSPQWHDAGQQDLAGATITAKVGPSEAKYIRLKFNVAEAGRIAALGVYAPASVADFTMPRPRKLVGMTSGNFAPVNYNLTDLHTKARALYVSSGDDMKLANNMIDDQASTVYTFGANDTSPTAVIDLGRSMPLRRISTLAKPGAGAVSFYVLEALPVAGRDNAADLNAPGAPNPSAIIEGTPSENAPPTLRLDDSMLAGLKAVGSANDDGTGHVAIDFPETHGRYVMVKWAPSTQEPFSVAEIAAFGRGGPHMLMASNTAVARGHRGIDYSDSKIVRDGKDAKDIPAEGPEEQPPAEGPPPSLPQPPPFVFIPQIVPTSL